MLSIAPELARSVLDAAPDAMIIIDAEGVIRFANRQVCALFGYVHEDLIGRQVELLMPERLRGRHVGHRHEYMSRMRMRPMGQGLALHGRRLDGTEFPLEISLSPIDGRDPPIVVAAIRDVSDRMRIESELVAARTLAEGARELADRANQGKSRFLATASHDLRQPLQSLALLNGTMRRTVTDPDAAEALTQQEQAIGAMSRLLNALLDISKLESGAVKPEPADFAVATIFEELRREFASLAVGRGLQLDVEDCAACCAHSDPSLVEQILRNLVANAIKYTRRGGVVVRCLLVPDSVVCLQVIDSGIGIPADQLACIYDEFYQVGVSANTSRDGYGLGLSIVKRIVELLNLKLEVRSRVGEGSSFSLLLPPANGRVAAPPHESDRTPARATTLGRRAVPHVLLVEDDPGVRDATRMLLTVEGYRVTAVASLTEAVHAAQTRGRIDLLVTDYHLRDGETGIQVIAALREAMGLPLKAVLITGDTSNAIRELPRDPDLRITSKPIRADEMLLLLRALLGPDDAATAEAVGHGIDQMCGA